MSVLTITEAAKIAKCGTSTLRTAILNGRLTARKSGSVWIITPHNLQKWIDDPAMHRRGFPAGRARK